MENIPQDVLFEAYTEAERGPGSAANFLRIVGQHFADAAEKTRALRKKSWQSTSRELDGVADHIRAYADQLAAFIVNNPDGVTLVDDDGTDPNPWPLPGEDMRTDAEIDNGVEIALAEQSGRKGKAAKPQLPGNTGRCASFRRANPDDQALCVLERGHEGDHAGSADGNADFTWPRRTSASQGAALCGVAGEGTTCARPAGHGEYHIGYTGDDRGQVGWDALAPAGGQVCGDVIVLHDGTALNCAREFGHDGTEHYDGRYRLWPRGEGTSRQTTVCERCNMDTHQCPGCGEPIGHYAGDCGKGCTDDPPLTTDDELFPGQCEARQDDERCMLPGTHTGKHKGRKGTGWDRAAEPVAVIALDDPGTLGEIAEQQRAAMIPGQRAESDGPVTVSTMTPPPGMAIVARLKEEVSATVADMTGDEPIGTTVNVGGIEFVKHSNNPFSGNPLADAVLSNPFAAPVPVPVQTPAAPWVPDAAWKIVGSTEPERPAVPRAAFLPPHLVPGAPRERYSVSSVDAMADCGLKFRLKYRDGVADTNVSWAGVGGKAFHKVVETIEREHAESTDGRWSAGMALLDQERTAATLWKNSFADTIAEEEKSTGVPPERWRATNGGREDRAWWLHSGEAFVRAYVRWRPGFLAEGWALLRKPDGTTAQEVEFDVSVGGVMNKGFIDAAWVNVERGVIRVVDYKSGTSDNKPFQLKTYGHALRALGALGEYRVEGAFYDARKAQWYGVPLELSADDDAEVEYRFLSTAAADRAGIFLARPSSYCGGCPVKDSCPIMAKKG